MGNETQEKQEGGGSASRRRGIHRYNNENTVKKYMFKSNNIELDDAVFT